MASFKNSADLWISLRGSGLDTRFMVTSYHQRFLFDIDRSGPLTFSFEAFSVF
jgi:hypothetical protein